MTALCQRGSPSLTTAQGTVCPGSTTKTQVINSIVEGAPLLLELGEPAALPVWFCGHKKSEVVKS